jgi:hypothetical protein
MICFLKKVKKNREESWFSHVVPNTPATWSRWTPQLSLHAWATQILVKFEQSKEKKNPWCKVRAFEPTFLEDLIIVTRSEGIIWLYKDIVSWTGSIFYLYIYIRSKLCIVDRSGNSCSRSCRIQIVLTI